MNIARATFVLAVLRFVILLPVMVADALVQRYVVRPLWRWRHPLLTTITHPPEYWERELAREGALREATVVDGNHRCGADVLWYGEPSVVCGVSRAQCRQCYVRDRLDESRART